MLRLFGGAVLDVNVSVYPKAVSRAMYPVPTKKAVADAKIRPSDKGVPSSKSWKPTRLFRRSTQRVAVIAPR